jgi:hypothetical protein
MSSYLDQPLTPDPVIEAYKKDVDRTLLRENLKLTVEQRFRNLMAVQKAAAELRAAGAKALKKQKSK